MARRPALLLALALIATPAPAAEISPIPRVARMGEAGMAPVPFDLAPLKANWRQRIEALRATGVIPLIDVESNLDQNLDVQSFAREMDREGVALIAISGQPRQGWSEVARYAVAADPWRYIPTGDGGLPPDWKKDPEAFARLTRTRIGADGYPLMGEYEFRHYPSPDQVRRGKTDREEFLELDSPAGHLLFAFAQESGVPFQIHQEIEDRYLPVLEKMLGLYPGARVIWCHLSQMRYQARNTIYGPDYVRRLVETYPKLYFDLSVGPPGTRHPLSGEEQGKYWDPARERLKPEWARLIADHPWRFMTALDLSPGKAGNLARKVLDQRLVLESLPAEVRDIVAWKAAWKLILGEDY